MDPAVLKQRVTRIFRTLVGNCQTVAEKAMTNPAIKISDEFVLGTRNASKSITLLQKFVEDDDYKCVKDMISEFYSQHSSVVDDIPIDTKGCRAGPPILLPEKTALISPTESESVAINVGLFLHLASLVDMANLTEKSMTLLILLDIYKLIYISTEDKESTLHSLLQNKCKSLQEEIGITVQTTSSSGGTAPDFSPGAMFQALQGQGGLEGLMSQMAPFMTSMKPMIKGMAMQADPNITPEQLAQLDNMDMSMLTGAITDVMRGMSGDSMAKMMAGMAPPAPK